MVELPQCLLGGLGSKHSASESSGSDSLLLAIGADLKNLHQGTSEYPYCDRTKLNRLTSSEDTDNLYISKPVLFLDLRVNIHTVIGPN